MINHCDIVQRIERCVPLLSGLVSRRADALADECHKLGIDPANAKVAVMYGGGKDSTIALILSKAISQKLGCGVRAITMVHPGLSHGTVRNIEGVRNFLEVEHEWRQFMRVVSGATESDTEWRRLYTCLAQATGCHPRFMCVACNFGSVVVEYKGLDEGDINFRVTGNPAREEAEFSRWAFQLKNIFSGQVKFPPALGIALLDYYRLWHAVYERLLDELNKISDSVGVGDLQLGSYLYELPDRTSRVADVHSFSVLEDGCIEYVPSEYQKLLELVGWRLPDDIQGGTESDCMMPAAIASIDIRQNGLPVFLEHLDSAAELLKPLPEMRQRAEAWAREGRSVLEGDSILERLGLHGALEAALDRKTPVATALVEQLLPVR